MEKFSRMLERALSWSIISDWVWEKAKLEMSYRLAGSKPVSACMYTHTHTHTHTHHNFYALFNLFR